MKKSTRKGLAIAALIIAACVGYQKFGKAYFMAKASKSKQETSFPKEFATKADDKGNFTKFWFDGKQYWKQSAGPMVKSKPVEIQEAEYSQQYVN